VLQTILNIRQKNSMISMLRVIAGSVPDTESGSGIWRAVRRRRGEGAVFTIVTRPYEFVSKTRARSPVCRLPVNSVNGWDALSSGGQLFTQRPT
jgi:hypothetical protein